MGVIVTYNDIPHTHATLGITAVTNIVRPILPYTRDRLMPITGKDGAYDFGRDLEPYEYEIRFLFEGSTLIETMQRSHAIAAWLNQSEVRRLTFDDEPNVFYMARPVRKIWVDRTVRIGIASVTFVIPDACAHAVTAKTVDPAVTPFPATNEGTKPCPAIVTLTMAEVSPGLTVDFPCGEFILVHTLAISDVVVVDTNTSMVTVNGFDARASVSFTSAPYDDLLLPVGDFTITADPVSTVINSVVYRERYV